MIDNRAVVPLYLNNDAVRNLFTIVINEFVEAETRSTKEQITINCSIPFSEFSYDILGKYVQGNATIQLSNEFAKQRTEAVISKEIDIFMNLRNILLKNNLIKNINNEEPFQNIAENEFVMLNCHLQKNPIFNYMDRIVKSMEIKNCLLRNDKNTNDGEILNKLKEHYNDWKENRNVSYYSKEICSPEANCIVPIEYKNSLGNLDYITHGSVSVFGKVTEVIPKGNVTLKQALCDRCFDYIFEDYFSKYVSDSFGVNPLLINDSNLISSDKNMFKVLPLAIFF